MTAGTKHHRPSASSCTEKIARLTEHVVIVGGGFGGWYAARHLAAILPLEHRITLIDRVDHMLYTPMLTEAAGGTVPSASIAVPFKNLPRRVRTVKGEIEAVDVQTKTVHMQTGEVLEATHLVIALGSTTAYHDVVGARENSIPLKTLAQADQIRKKLDAMIDNIPRGSAGDSNPHVFSLVVAGGGYTGVESVAALNERMRERAEANGLLPEQVTATIIETSKRLMSEIPESLAEYSKHQITKDGVRVVLGLSVNEVTKGRIELSSGEYLPTSLLLWDAGIEPSPLLQTMDVPKGKHHGVVVDDRFRVQGKPGVWAIGDCAEIPQPGGKGTYAPTAQNATREGVQLARNIVALIKGRELKPFRFTMLGQLALISKRDAVAEILGIKLRGWIAWAMWWVIYIAKLPDTGRRITVLRRRLTES